MFGRKKSEKKSQPPAFKGSNASVLLFGFMILIENVVCWRLAADDIELTANGLMPFQYPVGFDGVSEKFM